MKDLSIDSLYVTSLLLIKHNSTICMETWANGHRISTAPIPPVQSLILRDRLWAHFGSIGAVAMIRSTTIAAQPDR
jgi:hypothetical protein